MKDYWNKRFELLETKQMNKAEDYYKLLAEEYNKSLVKVNEDIKNWYNRFAINNDISLLDAKRLLKSDELKEFSWNIDEYIKYGQENGISEIWKKELENASSKVHISRLNALKIQIQNEIEKLYYSQNKDIANLEKEIYQDTYYHTAYELQKGFNVGFNFATLDDDKINKVLSKPWTTDNITFSDRIWKNKDKLLNTLNTELTQAIIRGDRLENVINTIAKKFNTSRGNAGNLVMTESAFFSSTARNKCFKELNVEKYEIVATLDMHTSDTCRELDGKVFNITDYEPGVTASPFHNWCRSTEAPWFEDDFEFSERAARNTNGKTYYISSDIKYEEWYKSNVKASKMVNEVLDDMPKSIKKIIDNISIEGNSKISGYNRKLNQINLTDDATKYEIIHELGHAIETKLDIYNSPYFIDIIKDNISEFDIITAYTDTTSYEQEIDIVNNIKFISEYQGRIYNFDMYGNERYNNSTHEFNYKVFGEYFSEGFREYFENNKNLLKKDKKLFNYIKELVDG